MLRRSRCRSWKRFPPGRRLHEGVAHRAGADSVCCGGVAPGVVWLAFSDWPGEVYSQREQRISHLSFIGIGGTCLLSQSSSVTKRPVTILPKTAEELQKKSSQRV